MSYLAALDAGIFTSSSGGGGGTTSLYPIYNYAISAINFGVFPTDGFSFTIAKPGTYVIRTQLNFIATPGNTFTGAQVSIWNSAGPLVNSVGIILEGGNVMSIPFCSTITVDTANYVLKLRLGCSTAQYNMSQATLTVQEMLYSPPMPFTQ